MAATEFLLDSLLAKPPCPVLGLELLPTLEVVLTGAFLASTGEDFGEDRGIPELLEEAFSLPEVSISEVSLENGAVERSLSNL